MGNVRVAHYLASFHKNAVFVKTRYCFICPPSVAEMDCVQGWTRYKSSRCLYSNCARCTVRVQTRVDHRTRMYDGQRLEQDRNLKICKDFGVPHRLHIRLIIANILGVYRCIIVPRRLNWRRGYFQSVSIL